MQALDGLFPTHPPCLHKTGFDTVLAVNQPEKQKIAVEGANFNVEERKAFIRKFSLRVFSTF